MTIQIRCLPAPCHFRDHSNEIGLSLCCISSDRKEQKPCLMCSCVHIEASLTPLNAFFRGDSSYNSQSPQITYNIQSWTMHLPAAEPEPPFTHLIAKKNTITQSQAKQHLSNISILLKFVFERRT